MSISSSTSSASRCSTSPETEKADRLRRAARRGWTPPPRISLPEWADRFRVLAREAGSTSGKYRTGRVEIARGPMLAATEPGVRKISAMVATQLLKTTLIENIVGFHVHLDPCPMLIVQPKDAAAEQFSKERVGPFIKATPALRKLVGQTKSRDAGDTIDYKAFPGGFLGIVGAGSPDNLARRPVRIVLCDEVDKYLPLKEGDPLAIVEERQATFDSNSLNVAVCSPTVTGESKIEVRYLASDQRRASVECPECGHRQFPDFFTHVHWDKGADDNSHRPETARVYCEKCGVGWTEGQRLRALTTIRWHQTRPFQCCDQWQVPQEAYAAAVTEGHPDPLGLVWDWWESPRHAVYRARCRECGDWAVSNEHAGFQAGKLFSPWANDAPPRQAAKWLAATDEDGKQTFYNTQLARTYRQNVGKAMNPDTLTARREIWAAQVPDGVAVITCGIDVQDYRVELETVGWGRDEESWSIDYEIFDGEFDDPRLQARLDEYLQKKFYRADGRPFAIHAACIDTGGHHTNAVYEFAKARLGRFIWGVKGESARTGQRNPVWPTKRPSSRSKKTYRPIIVGVNAAKDTIRNYLGKDQPGPGYMHFNVDRDAIYFAQLTAEQIVLKVIGGQKFRIWELPGGRANEALDCRVYAYAALHGLMHRNFKLNREADRVGATAEGQTILPPPDTPAAATNTEATGPTITAAPAERPKKRSLGAMLARGA
ncbi:phage terminase large subunit family protein [Novosphingobium sp. KA1]|uniref:phage terminase large subunit family protein n=1 Tax=Novosphingobium sp. (strain KA1) TaxID=164608 RepID=UPI001A8CCF75|nr:terminase gpA endonuclease subunit [Novosphingobium sp. KA1]QSR16058.1 terminase [Novosphingobium sp. KA1]